MSTVRVRSSSYFEDLDWVIVFLCGSALSFSYIIQHNPERRIGPESAQPSPFRCELAAALRDTRGYLRATLHFLGGGPYDPSNSALRELPVPGRVHCFGRALHAVLWNIPHCKYSFARD